MEVAYWIRQRIQASVSSLHQAWGIRHIMARSNRPPPPAQLSNSTFGNREMTPLMIS